jgi:hypothetical protein
MQNIELTFGRNALFLAFSYTDHVDGRIRGDGAAS